MPEIGRKAETEIEAENGGGNGGDYGDGDDGDDDGKEGRKARLMHSVSYPFCLRSVLQPICRTDWRRSETSKRITFLWPPAHPDFYDVNGQLFVRSLFDDFLAAAYVRLNRMQNELLNQAAREKQGREKAVAGARQRRWMGRSERDIRDGPGLSD